MLLHPNRPIVPRRGTNGGIRFRVLLLGLVMAAFGPLPTACGGGQPEADTRSRTEIPYREGTVVLVSDYQDLGKVLRRVQGNVEIRFGDFAITTDEAEYDVETGDGHTVGETRFSQGDQWLTCSRADFNFRSQTGTCYDARGYTDREFSIFGRELIKTGADTYRIHDAAITSCREDNPKWQFTASRADIRLDHTARLRNTFLKIKGVPVFYTPYTVLPLEKKKRSSGFTTFQTGTSTSKGRVFSQGYYQTLGRSADLSLFGDYFSLRGLALGVTVRTRPNPQTFFDIEAYGIRDRRDQGGVRLVVDGETRLPGDWRAVARVNITSSFEFRQAFADSFNKATVATEHVDVFLTQNRDNVSTNISFQRQEVTFPVQSLVTWNIPSIGLSSRETPVGATGLLYSFESSVGGLSRRDGGIDTESIVQRLDIHPRLALRLPALAGFSVVPSFGVRETYYGARIDADALTGIRNQGFRRGYTDLEVDLKTPYLEKDYAPSWAGPFRHAVLPYATYRWIRGAGDLERIIRFDAYDAVADTNEFEYGIVNRFYTRGQNGSGATEKREFLTVALAQKYYFDPSFGGAFRSGRANAFYPLYTTTGFYGTGVERVFSPLSAEIRVRIKDRMYQDIRADYDTKLRRWRNVGLSTGWQQGSFSLSGTYFRAIETEPGMLSASQLQSEISYGTPARGLASSVSISYNFQSDQLLNSRTRVGYAWDCCSLSSEFRQFSLDARTESQFSFSFWLKGIGSLGSMMEQNSLF